MPKISVIVPVYNTEKYLCRCIDSILAQSFTDFELLLIDDGSKDSSGSICDDYVRKDNRVCTFHMENGGVSFARKIGVQNANGEFLIFVDSDDYVTNNALEILVSSCKERDEIIIAGCGDERILKSEEYVRGLLENRIPWGLWSKMYRSSLFDDEVCSVPRYYNIGEDLMVQLMLAARTDGSIRCIKETIYTLYNNPLSVTHTRQYSVEYEQNFITEICRLTRCFDFDVSASLFRLKMSSLRMLIWNGIRVSYDEPWVKELIDESQKIKTTTIDKMILAIPYNFICRLLLRIKDFVL